ncbi:MAG: hypothetical protein H6625_05745 [Bdellovibrionaceae bacterium]|nr:hypothetical protein [Pseudobdellovibrionaceae bacterium]
MGKNKSILISVVVIVLLGTAYFVKQKNSKIIAPPVAPNSQENPIEKKPPQVNIKNDINDSYQFSISNEEQTKMKRLTKEQVEKLLDPMYIIIEREDLIKLNIKISEMEGKLEIIKNLTENHISNWEDKRKIIRDMAETKLKLSYLELKDRVEKTPQGEAIGNIAPIKQKIVKELEKLKKLQSN